MTASRPPGRRISSAAGSARSSEPSSSLTSIRSAWKTRLAGWPSPKRAGAGIACLIVSTRSPVRSNGCLRAAADDRARDLARVPLLAVAAEDVGELALVGLVDELARGVARRSGPCACRAARRPRTRSRARAGRAASTRRRGRAGSRRRARRSSRAGRARVENSPESSRVFSGAAAAQALEVRRDARVAVDRDQLALAVQARGEQARSGRRRRRCSRSRSRPGAGRGRRGPRRRGRGRDRSQLARRSATSSALPSTSCCC